MARECVNVYSRWEYKERQQYTGVAVVDKRASKE